MSTPDPIATFGFYIGDGVVDAIATFGFGIGYVEPVETRIAVTFRAPDEAVTFRAPDEAVTFSVGG